MMVVMVRKCMINDETVTPITYLFWPDFFIPTTLKSFPRDLFFGCTLKLDSSWGRIALGHIIKKGFEGHAPPRNRSYFLNVRDQGSRQYGRMIA